MALRPEDLRYFMRRSLAKDLNTLDAVREAELVYVTDTGEIYVGTKTGVRNIVTEAISGAIIPTIGDNGNWFIQGNDTGRASRGPKGDAYILTDADKREIEEISGNYAKAAEKSANEALSSASLAVSTLRDMEAIQQKVIDSATEVATNTLEVREQTANVTAEIQKFWQDWKPIQDLVMSVNEDSKVLQASALKLKQEINGVEEQVQLDIAQIEQLKADIQALSDEIDGKVEQAAQVTADKVIGETKEQIDAALNTVNVARDEVLVLRNETRVSATAAATAQSGSEAARDASIVAKNASEKAKNDAQSLITSASGDFNTVLTQAQTAANNADNAAGRASASATSASNSAAAAGTSATNAKASETAAGVSETKAKQSETTAGEKVTLATEQADRAKAEADRAAENAASIDPSKLVKSVNNIKPDPTTGNVTIDVGVAKWEDIQNKPTFASVATSGMYNDLIGKPEIPVKYVKSIRKSADKSVTFTNSDGSNTLIDVIKNAVQLDGKEASLYQLKADMPTLATVAQTGRYADLLEKPSLDFLPITGGKLTGGLTIQSETSSQKPFIINNTAGQLDFSLEKVVNTADKVEELRFNTNANNDNYNGRIIFKIIKASGESSWISMESASTLSRVLLRNIEAPGLNYDAANKLYVDNNSFTKNKATLEEALAGLIDNKAMTPKSTAEVVKKKGSIPVGFVKYNPFGTIEDGWLNASSGATVERTAYPDLWAYVQANPTLLKTEEEWQALSTSQEGHVPYYSSGDGTTTFRLPAILWYGCGTKDTSLYGKFATDTQRNITGSIGEVFAPNPPHTTGAFTEEVSRKIHVINDSTDNHIWKINFDASRSVGAEHTGDTVKPKTHYGCYVVKAYGTVSNTGNVDIQNVVNAQTVLENRVTAIEDRKPDLDNLSMPSDSAVAITLTQQNQAWTAPSDGWVWARKIPDGTVAGSWCRCFNNPDPKQATFGTVFYSDYGTMGSNDLCGFIPVAKGATLYFSWANNAVIYFIPAESALASTGVFGWATGSAPVPTRLSDLDQRSNLILGDKDGFFNVVNGSQREIGKYFSLNSTKNTVNVSYNCDVYYITYAEAINMLTIDFSSLGTTYVPEGQGIESRVITFMIQCSASAPPLNWTNLPTATVVAGAVPTLASNSINIINLEVIYNKLQDKFTLMILPQVSVAINTP